MSLQAFQSDQAICGICQGSGWETVEGKGARRCACRRDYRIARLLEASRIPLRFDHAAFESYTAFNPQLQNALNHAKRLVAEYPGAETGALLMGNPGCGKTHLAVAMLRELIKLGHSGLFYDCADLLTEIRDSYNPAKNSSELSILSPVLDTDVLLLDELGFEKPTDWVLATLTHIVNARYNQRRFTIFTTNYLDKGGQVSDETLADRIGPRFRSRLHEMCRLITIQSDDYREVIRSKRNIGQIVK